MSPMSDSRVSFETYVCKYERTSKYKRHSGFSCITETLDRNNENK